MKTAEQPITNDRPLYIVLWNLKTDKHVLPHAEAFDTAAKAERARHNHHGARIIIKRVAK